MGRFDVERIQVGHVGNEERREMKERREGKRHVLLGESVEMRSWRTYGECGGEGGQEG